MNARIAAVVLGAFLGGCSVKKPAPAPKVEDAGSGQPRLLPPERCTQEAIDTGAVTADECLNIIVDPP